MTIGFAREAAAAAVPDQPVAPVRPMLFRHELHQVLLDFFRVGLARNPKSMREPDHVGVDDDSLVFMKGVAENHVRRLPAHARQPVQFFHRVGNAPAVLGNDGAGRAANALRFAPKKTSRANHFFQSGRRCFRVIGRTAVLREQGRRDGVHSLVGALSGQNRGDQ